MIYNTLEIDGTIVTLQFDENLIGTVNNSERKMSPYINFCYQNRNIIKNTFGSNLTFGELGRLLGKCWQELDVEFKNNFTQDKSK